MKELTPISLFYSRWEGYPSYSFHNSIVLNPNYENSVFGLCAAYELCRLINDTNKCSEQFKGIINPHEMAKYMSINIMLPKHLLCREKSMPLKNLSEIGMTLSGFSMPFRR